MMRRVIVLFVVLLAMAIGGGWALWQGVTAPYRGFAEAEIFVDLPQGSRTVDIARLLADAGVVRDPLTFRLAVRLADADRRLQAGEYRFLEAASPEQIITRLSRGDTYTRALTFPEGLNIRDMAAIFEKSGMGTATEFVTAANATALIADIDPDAGNLEGYLFPSTYALPRRAGAEGVVRAMVKEFRKALGTEPLPPGMTARELVALASIVEKETAQGSERPVVAGVYANRLRIGMPLQCDPTVIYAMMLNKTWNGNIRKTDLAMDSPYNTYKYAGLPPGPIASPGKGSLDAARHPADVKYLYFVSRNDGTHVFAAT
ncbi:MAG: endolytic transglycosylase MltG, partial [Acidobacteria bacterium]|nr:endolytic transglycosylase MltG [Acidobacteriota bacterium]